MSPDLRLIDKVAQAVQASAAFVVSGAAVGAPVIAVALSGGRDSVALLHAAREAATRLGTRVVALHVHHGLQADADAWEAFCAMRCGEWGVSLHTERVTVVAQGGEGIEAAARRARYDALGRMCRAAGAPMLMFAHHRDDQVETVLLRLFRGAGVAGLAGMPASRPLDAGGDVRLLRPWLDVSRAEIDAYCARHALRWIEDPSNTDTRFARNALRAHLPALVTAFSGLHENVVQAAAHIAQAADMLEDMTQRDLVPLVRAGRDGDTYGELDLPGLRALPPARADAVLRAWLRDLGAQPPSTARLADMRRQLIDSDGGEPSIAHDGLVLHRFRDRVLACRPPLAAVPDALAFVWREEAEVAVPMWRGALRFTRDDTFGVPEAVLRAPMRVVARAGGERIVLRPGGPARALKQAYQEAGVPAWRRECLPLLWAGDTLVLAAGLGQHRRWPEAPNTPPASHAPRWRVEWVPEPLQNRPDATP
ncbi:tRNA lysidine(34) synthetase TilS [Cupriavidus plantarum]|uniref:tRNA lysidine(34) synthetase TilS n=1 Tax=Cupriavidus plantarum TaxID=942865 RepID=UPI00339D58BF